MLLTHPSSLLLPPSGASWIVRTFQYLILCNSTFTTTITATSTIIYTTIFVKTGSFLFGHRCKAMFNTNSPPVDAKSRSRFRRAPQPQPRTHQYRKERKLPKFMRNAGHVLKKAAGTLAFVVCDLVGGLISTR